MCKFWNVFVQVCNNCYKERERERKRTLSLSLLILERNYFFNPSLNVFSRQVIRWQLKPRFHINQLSGFLPHRFGHYIIFSILSFFNIPEKSCPLGVLLVQTVGRRVWGWKEAITLDQYFKQIFATVCKYQRKFQRTAFGQNPPSLPAGDHHHPLHHHPLHLEHHRKSRPSWAQEY